VCFTFIVKSHSASVLRERPLFKSASLGEREFVLLSFIAFLFSSWSGEFLLLIFIVALVLTHSY